ncbi:SusE domain-containing protein [Dawidia soli]|uniref:SusF/SusE family outer membrane protein n=1 Tax=Dawidia soli TaxID=2782352 RepID=A0AAP2DD81_9BACT|nr:SusF/SusE family outer membrane protein [Dawidia soli]MBT1688585.1 SusF/SusE family outer membrane protein [Dawidia soli]
MKNNNYINRFYYAATLLLLVTLFSCSDDDPRQVPIDVGVLSASKAEVVVDYDKPTDEVITFSWHAEKSSLVQYKLVFTANGKSDTVDVLSEVSRKFIHAAFNKIMVDDLGLEIGKPASVDVVVVANVTDGTKSSLSNVITVVVTPSPKVPEPALDDVTLSVSKTEVYTDLANPAGEAVTLAWATAKSLFIEYKIVLTAGTWTTTVDVLTDVSKEFTHVDLNNLLIDKLRIEAGKTADVTAQVTASVIISDKVVKSNPVMFKATPTSKDVTPAAYTKMWIVGDATPNGWNKDNPNEMAADPTNIYQFKYNEVLTNGKFKIMTGTGNWSVDSYMPPVDNGAVTSTDVNLHAKATPDNKWDVVDAGPYKIILNIGANRSIRIMKYVPFDQLYILGDATSAGWDPANAIAMTADPDDPYVFTWTGELNAAGRGQFTFPVSSEASNTTFFAAPTSGAGITATQLSFTSTGTSVNKFKLKAGEEGTYTITVNQLKETISIVKQ